MKGGQHGRVRSGRDEPPATEGSSKSLDPKSILCTGEAVGVVLGGRGWVTT